MLYYTFFPFYFFEYLMLRINTGKARIDGRDINVPCIPLKLPACAGEGRVTGAIASKFDFPL